MPRSARWSATPGSASTPAPATSRSATLPPAAAPAANPAENGPPMIRMLISIAVNRLMHAEGGETCYINGWTPLVTDPHN
jgi:hypothetical protein